MSYTKGPWRIGARCNSVVSDGNGGISIGGATGDDAVEYYGGNLIAESISECNLIIIAAAPDLYEALKAAIECGMVPASSARDGGAVRHSKQAHVADQIRAALAKAEGRNND